MNKDADMQALRAKLGTLSAVELAEFVETLCRERPELRELLMKELQRQF